MDTITWLLLLSGWGLAIIATIDLALIWKLHRRIKRWENTDDGRSST